MTKIWLENNFFKTLKKAQKRIKSQFVQVRNDEVI